MNKHLSGLMERYPVLKPLRDEIMNAFDALTQSYRNDGKLLVCGNGGSAADADHIVGELMKGFYLKRELDSNVKQKFGSLGDKLQGALPAISLTHHTALSTAFQNDVDPSLIYAQQVFGYGKCGDVLFAISTSGNSLNIINAIKIAKASGLVTIGLTGRSGGEMMDLCDICINVPSDITAEVQELHLPVYHTLCAMLEEEFFGI